MTKVKFQELFASPLRNGVSYPARSRGSGIPMINMGEAFAYDRISDEKCERVPLTKKEKESFLLREGDLLFVRQSLAFKGAGKCILVLKSEEDRTWESHLIRARLDESKASPPFYFYFFNSPAGRKLIETIIEQVAAAGIRGSELAKLPVPLPALATQRAIAEVLGALDDKIEVNDRIASLAREYLAAEFSLLEVDSSDAPLNSSLEEMVHLNPNAQAPAVSEAVYLDMKNLPDKAMTVTNWGHRPARGGARFQNGDTLLARITPCLENGKVGYVDFLDDCEVGIGSTEFIVLRPRTGIPAVLPYFLASSPRFRDFAIKRMVGTSGRQRLAAADLADYPLHRPEAEEFVRFESLSSALMERVKAAVDESRKLSATRDELLPLLMSGKIRVRDAEKVIEGVI